jgi:hypothetical protein
MFFLLLSIFTGYCLTSAHADTVTISFPAALNQSTGLTDAAGGSLNGYLVRIGSLGTNSPVAIVGSLDSLTTGDVLQQIESQFTPYDSFTFLSSFLSEGTAVYPQDPDNTLQLPIGPNLRGRPVDLIFYNSSLANTASQIAIFRMKPGFRVDNPDGSAGVFSTATDLSGNRVVFFDLVPTKVDSLLGFFNPVANRFETALLDGGVRQITSVLTTNNTAGSPASYQILANNGADRFFATTNTSGVDLTETTLPTGFSIGTNTGIISVATNASAGTYPIRLVASNSLTASVATNTLNWVLQAATLSFTTTTNQISATAGVEISPFTFVSTGTGPTYTISSGSLLGLSLSSGGLLSGIPTSPGTNDVTVQSSAGGLSATTTFSLAVAAPTLSIPGDQLSGGQLIATSGTARTVALTKTAGFTNLTGSVNPTTTGVSFDGTSLVIASNAAPLRKGTTSINLTLTASRAVGGSTVSATNTVPLRIVAPVPTTLVGTNEFNGTLEQSFSNTLTTTAGSFAKLISVSNLPLGLSFREGGLVSGVFSGSIRTNVVVAVAVFDSTGIFEGGGVLSANLTFRLSSLPPVITSSNRQIGGVGRSLTYSISASNAPSRYEILGNLPPGLARTDGGRTIQGRPTAAGNFPLVLKAYNSSQPGSTNLLDEQSGTADFTLLIAGTAPSVSTPVASLNNMTRGMVHTNTPFITTDGGMRLFATGLPTGLFLDEYEGTLRGTNQATGTFSVTLYLMSGAGWTIRNTTLTVR